MHVIFYYAVTVFNSRKDTKHKTCAKSYNDMYNVAQPYLNLLVKARVFQVFWKQNNFTHFVV